MLKVTQIVSGELGFDTKARLSLRQSSFCGLLLSLFLRPVEDLGLGHYLYFKKIFALGLYLKALLNLIPVLNFTKGFADVQF